MSSDDPHLDYASPQVKTAKPDSARPPGRWVILLLVWAVGLVVWAAYLIALVYLIIRIL
jgi:hypothetical protein